jgi:hypothetical protein
MNPTSLAILAHNSEFRDAGSVSADDIEFCDGGGNDDAFLRRQRAFEKRKQVRDATLVELNEMAEDCTFTPDIGNADAVLAASRGLRHVYTADESTAERLVVRLLLWRSLAFSFVLLLR